MRLDRGRERWWCGHHLLLHVLHCAGKASGSYETGSRFQHTEKLQFAKIVSGMTTLYLIFQL